jgi:hypothetical protein
MYVSASFSDHLVSFCSALAETQVLGNSLLALATLALDEASRPQLVSQGVANAWCRYAVR